MNECTTQKESVQSIVDANEHAYDFMSFGKISPNINQAIGPVQNSVVNKKYYKRYNFDENENQNKNYQFQLHKRTCRYLTK